LQSQDLREASQKMSAQKQVRKTLAHFTFFTCNYTYYTCIRSSFVLGGEKGPRLTLYGYASGFFSRPWLQVSLYSPFLGWVQTDLACTTWVRGLISGSYGGL
jgi:hypothetical protein